MSVGLYQGISLCMLRISYLLSSLFLYKSRPNESALDRGLLTSAILDVSREMQVRWLLGVSQVCSRMACCRAV